MPEKFAERVRRLRTEAHMTREDLAAATGISAHTLHSMEIGRTANPTLDTLRRLATALRVTVAELVD